MNEKTMTPIGSMAALLAEMTERAIEAERQRDAAKKDAETWYQHFQNKAAKLNEAEEALAAQVNENEKLRRSIEEYIENSKNGVQENG